MVKTALLKAVIFMMPFALLSVNAKAQVVIKDIVNNEKCANYHFPLIQGNNHIANNINTVLQVWGLGNSPNYTGDLFKNNVQGEQQGKGCSGVVAIDYKVNINTPKILSLTIMSEMVGAYSSGYSEFYNFDIATGQPLVLNQIVTDKGFKWLEQVIKKERSNIITNVLKKPESFGFEKDDSEFLADFYNDCKERLFDLHHNDLVFTRTGIELVPTTCASGNLTKVYDIFPRTKVSYKQLQPYLNGYGSCLLQPSKKVCKQLRPQIPPAIYQSIDDKKQVITLILRGNFGKIMADYFYHGDKKLYGGQSSYDSKTNQLIINSYSDAKFDLTVNAKGELTGNMFKNDETTAIIFRLIE